MYLTIAIIVGLLIAIPTLILWLLRTRKGVKSGPFHDQVRDATLTGGASGGGHDAGGGPS